MHSYLVPPVTVVLTFRCTVWGMNLMRMFFLSP